MNPEIPEDNDTIMSEYELVAARIKHILQIYPRISPTMLQGGLGPQTKPEVWRPILEDMMQNNLVKQEVINSKSPLGRYNDYQVISLVTSN